MIIGQKAWSEIKSVKQEVLDLKQIKAAACASKYYIFTENSGSYHNNWLIKYKDGNQPIISEVLSYSFTSLSAPLNNQQYLFSFSQAITSLTILSTREIESIQGL